CRSIIDLNKIQIAVADLPSLTFFCPENIDKKVVALGKVRKRNPNKVKKVSGRATTKYTQKSREPGRKSAPMLKRLVLYASGTKIKAINVSTLESSASFLDRSAS